jgi:hypothetical protein
MLANQAVTAAQSSEQSASRARKALRRPSAARLDRWFAFAGAAAVLLVYGLRGGGSYDLVTFEEQGLVIWWVLAVGFALGLLPRRRPSRAVLLLWAALAAYAAWTALSLLWTQSAELTTEEVARSLDYLGLVVLAGCVLTRHSWRWAGAGLGLGAMIVCVIGLGSRLAPSVFGTDHVAALLNSDRLSYPFGYWDAMAAWGTMCTALGLVWSAHDSSRVRRAVALAFVPVAGALTYLTYSRAGAFGSAFAVIVVVCVSRNRITSLIHTAAAAAGTGIVILAIRSESDIAQGTGTRGAGVVFGALAFACGLAAVVALATRIAGTDRWRAPAPIGRALAIAASLVVVVAGAAAAPSAWRSFTRTTPVSSATDPAARLSSLAGSRYVVWKSAIKTFKVHPGGGTGAGTFEFSWNQQATDLEFVRDAHNIWLENMAELGLPGLLLVVAVAATALGVAVGVRIKVKRTVSAGVAATFLGVLVVYQLHASVDWMWESTAVTVLALAGVAVLGARLAVGRPRMRLPARAVLAAVAGVAAAAQLPGLMSTNDVRASQAAERTARISRALSAAQDAVAVEPWSATAHEQEALVLEAAGRLQQAKQQESLAISHESVNYVHYLIRSRIEVELGQLRQAVYDYGRAYQLHPNSSVFLFARYFKPS